ncbi:MAG: ATP-grasp domain-containing protein [Sulfuricurvum sp.]|uniref:ATP-grasp domain-containing protein n=1 Tax=Sulfuricurvum sp. TaxID=2025608 RepID=UPI0026078721|nr:ATP-grasp domain-containing protein [Sulfuricurvum sp.]MDD5159203.1 ATP-grasp domain-containing protein [Sulfuricurvum sp.]
MKNYSKNILLCDANFCVLPILQSIKSKGYTLSVVGSKLNDPAHFLADKSINLNYADVELLYKHISENKYDGVVPGCNDRSYMSLAYVAEKLKFKGFDDYETVLTIHHKDRFRAFAEQKSYPIPRAISNPDQVDLLNFPVLVKPVDSFSGKGINKAYSVDEFKAHWKEAKKFSQSGLVVAEEFVEGKLYSHSAFIKNKKIVVDFFVNEYCTVYPYQVNSSNVSSRLSQQVQQALRKWTEQFASDLDLCDGLIHTQFISNNETFYLIEIARRCPGDLYSQLIQKATGINYSELYSLPFLGLDLPERIEAIEPKFISRHTVSVDKDCVFISSSLNINSPHIQNVQLKYSGEPMKAAPFDKSGIYFIEHHNVEEMETLTEKLKDYVALETLELIQSHEG